MVRIAESDIEMKFFMENYSERNPYYGNLPYVNGHAYHSDGMRHVR